MLGPSLLHRKQRERPVSMGAGGFLGSLMNRLLPSRPRPCAIALHRKARY